MNLITLSLLFVKTHTHNLKKEQKHRDNVCPPLRTDLDLIYSSAVQNYERGVF